MEFKEAFKFTFGFDIFDSSDVYKKSNIGVLFDSLEKAKEQKEALDFLKEKFGWKDNFSVYKYSTGIHKDNPVYGVDYDRALQITGVEKVE